MISSHKPSQPKQQRRESRKLRITLSLIGSIIATILLVAASYYSQQKQILASGILYALIPTVVFALLFGIIQKFDDNAEGYKREVDLAIENDEKIRTELSRLSGDITKIVRCVGKTLNLYEPIRLLLDKDPEQGRLIRLFLRTLMNTPLCIWNISDRVFFDLALEGARQCKDWKGIHHGPISALENAPYLEQLKKVEKTLRIVILKPEEVSELKDQEKVTRFLKDTEGTPSYWIDETEFFKLSRINPSVRLDCALHDENLLLQRHRNLNIIVMSFEGQHEEIYDGVKKAFEQLDLEIKKYFRLSPKFHKIVLPDDDAN